jgi:hypothetical protein
MVDREATSIAAEWSGNREAYRGSRRGRDGEGIGTRSDILAVGVLNVSGVDAEE